MCGIKQDKASVVFERFAGARDQQCHSQFKEDMEDI